MTATGLPGAATGLLAQGGLFPPGQGPIDTLRRFAPRLLLAALVLVVGYAVARVLAARAADLVARIRLGGAVLETPLSGVFRDEREVEATVARLTELLVLLCALGTAAAIVDFSTVPDLLLSGARYLPSVLGGLLMVLVGFVAAGYVGRSAGRSEVLAGRPYAPVVTAVAKFAVYFFSLTLGLDALGYSTAILATVAEGVALGLGLGIALALGIGVGMGSRDLVARRLETWLGDSPAADGEGAPTEADGSRR